MFDVFRTRYRLRRADTDTVETVPLSSFRELHRLEGPHQPAVYRVRYMASDGSIQDSLVTHESLDWDPLATHSSETFMDLMSGRRELVAREMLEFACAEIGHGRWPWVFWCHPESRVRPAFPSSVRLVSPPAAPTGADDRQGVLIRCPACRRATINLVTADHLDVPFYSDSALQYVHKMLPGDDASLAERFRHELNDPSVRTGWMSPPGRQAG